MREQPRRAPSCSRWTQGLVGGSSSPVRTSTPKGYSSSPAPGPALPSWKGVFHPSSEAAWRPPCGQPMPSVPCWGPPGSRPFALQHPESHDASIRYLPLTCPAWLQLLGEGRGGLKGVCSIFFEAKRSEGDALCFLHLDQVPSVALIFCSVPSILISF